MISLVDGGADEPRALRVCACDEEHGVEEEVELEAGGDEPGDVGRGGNEDFAGEVAAFFASVELVFEMDGGGTLWMGSLCCFLN